MLIKVTFGNQIPSEKIFVFYKIMENHIWQL